MSRNTHRTKARIDELAEELTIGAALRLRTDADNIRHIIDAAVSYLVEEYPAQDLYIPSNATYPVDAIRAAFAAGKSIRRICREFQISRKTFYRLLDTNDPHLEASP